MNTILPISDLRNYPIFLENVSEGNPVILTKNGKGTYVVMEIAEFEEYTKESAALKLLSELQSAEDESNREGLLTSQDVFSQLENRLNEIQNNLFSSIKKRPE